MQFRIIRLESGKFQPQFYNSYSGIWETIEKKPFETTEEAYNRCIQFKENDEIMKYKHVITSFEL